MLDSYNQETGHIKEWMIDRAERMRGFSSDISHQKNAAKVGSVLGGKTQGNIAVESGQLEKARKLSNPRGKKNFKPRNEFHMYENGNLIGTYTRIVDMAKAFECSVSQMSLYISGKKKSPEGYEFKKIRIRKPSLRTRRKYGEDDAWKAQ